MYYKKIKLINVVIAWCNNVFFHCSFFFYIGRFEKC